MSSISIKISFHCLCLLHDILCFYIQKEYQQNSPTQFSDTIREQSIMGSDVNCDDIPISSGIFNFVMIDRGKLI